MSNLNISMSINLNSENILKIINYLIIKSYDFSQMSEIDKRKKEVRERMEAQARNKKKKGFMTPERKKKLRVIILRLIIS